MARIEWAVQRLRKQPLPPVGVFFAELFNFGPSTPAWTVKIPHDLHFPDLPDLTPRDTFLSCDLIRLTSVLCADLDDQIREDRTASPAALASSSTFAIGFSQ